MSRKLKNKFHEKAPTWQGACIDSGAEKTVIGLRQAKAYCQFMKVPFKPDSNSNVYRFGEDSQKSLGSIDIRIPVPSSFICLKVDVVQADVPFLLGLDALDLCKFFYNNLTDELICPSLSWKLKVKRKLGHAYLEWKKEHQLLFTKSELIKLHRAFSHPNTEKLYNLLKRARPQDLTPDTRKTLSEIAHECRTCQKHSPKPHRYKVTMPPYPDLKFGEELSMDLMWINSEAVLHIVDTATRFSTATFLDDYGHSSSGVWNAFIDTWCTVYTGYPNKVRTDFGSNFQSIEFKNLCKKVGISLVISGTEAHNSLGIGERYHAPLRRIYMKTSEEYPHISKHIRLKIALKAMNDTMGENGLVPSLLVFGIIPRFPIITSDLPNQRERMEVLAAAQKEMNTIIAERRIITALTTNTPSSVDEVYQVGDKILIYREKEREWTGPHKVIGTDNDMVYVIGLYNRPQPFHKQQIKPFIQNPIDPSEFFIHLSNKFRSGSAPIPMAKVNITEVIFPADPRHKDGRFDEAKKKELKGLWDRGTFKVVLKEDVPKDANVLGARFVLSIKDEGTKREVWKARFIVQGYRDKMKTSLVHDSANARHHSVRLLVGLAAIFGFRLFSTDVTQAYLQSREKLLRDVYVKPSKEFELGPNQLLKLLKPLYGLADSGDYWGKTLRSHLQEDLGMSKSTIDDALYVRFFREQLDGLCATYVDDMLQAGTPKYSDNAKKTESSFQCKPREYDNVLFAGSNIDSHGDKFYIHMKNYANKLNLLPRDASLTEFRSLRQKLMWLVNTRPDIACSVAKSTQVTNEKYVTNPSKYVKILNRTLRYIRRSIGLKLKYPKLDKDSLRLQVYSDASYATNADNSSQLGYIIFLADKSNNCQPLAWSSHKAKRVNRSVLGSEIMAFADAFDMAFVLKHDIEAMIKKTLPIVMITDSLSLFDVITRASSTTEKRLMIDIESVRKAYKNKEIEKMVFVRSPFNPADALTKEIKSPILDQILHTGILEHPFEQWIDRK